MYISNQVCVITILYHIPQNINKFSYSFPPKISSALFLLSNVLAPFFSLMKLCYGHPVQGKGTFT